MAHILVYLQRTPRGLHPASAVALCLARDVASERGATVTAIGTGDGGPADASLARAAARFGADQLLLAGPTGFSDLVTQLRPAHVLVPWTREGLDAASRLGRGEPIPRWVDRRRPEFREPDALTAVVAGEFPWHDFPGVLEAEYGGDVAEGALPPWLTDGSTPPDFSAPVPLPGDATRGPGVFVAPLDLDDGSRAALERLDVAPVDAASAAAMPRGVVLWLDAGPAGLPASLSERPAGTPVVLIPGPNGKVQESWQQADWVLPGDWPEVLARLETAPWTDARHTPPG
jgi:hypothetical protein